MTRGSAVAYDHVAFDLDGTLIDSRADLATSVNHALHALGRAELPAQTLHGYVGDGAGMLVARALGPAHQALLPDALDRFLTHYGVHLLDRTRPYPGVEAMLTALQTRNIALSVLTNKPEAMSRTILEGLGLARFFGAIVGGDSTPVRKPDAAGVELLRTATRTPPGRFLLVGDSDVDLRTARAAGVAFCGVTWGLGQKSLEAAAPDRMISHPSELAAVVEG